MNIIIEVILLIIEAIMTHAKLLLKKIKMIIWK